MGLSTEFSGTRDAARELQESTAGSWKRLLHVFAEPERRFQGERRRGPSPLRCEDWSEGKRQTVRRAIDRP